MCVYIYIYACMLSRFSRVRLCATLWTAAHQAPLFMTFSRQEYWSGWPFPSPYALTHISCMLVYMYVCLCVCVYTNILFIYFSGEPWVIQYSTKKIINGRDGTAGNVQSKYCFIFYRKAMTSAWNICPSAATLTWSTNSGLDVSVYSKGKALF